jgi:adenosylmethionine-8-amino-7-oxononanoate aminotransferase
VLVAPRIWEPFYRDEAGTPVFRHGATYAGHATASAVALCHLDILDRDQLLPRVVELEAVLRDALDGLAQRQSAVVDVRVAGLLGGVTLADHLTAEHVADDMIDLGFITRPLRGNTLQISPPFIVSDDELVAFVAAIEHTVTARENR